MVILISSCPHYDYDKMGRVTNRNSTTHAYKATNSHYNFFLQEQHSLQNSFFAVRFLAIEELQTHFFERAEWLRESTLKTVMQHVCRHCNCQSANGLLYHQSWDLWKGRVGGGDSETHILLTLSLQSVTISTHLSLFQATDRVEGWQVGVLWWKSVY